MLTMRLYATTLLICLTFLVSTIFGQETDDEESKKGEELGTGEAVCPDEAFGQMCLRGDYRRQSPPIRMKKGGTEVNVTMRVNTITKIDSTANVIGMELSLSMEWRDARVEWKGWPRAGGEWLLLPDLMG